MKVLKTVNLVSWIVLISLAQAVRADLSPMAPFEGDAFEDFTSLLGSPFHVESVSIFDDTVTVNNLTEGGSIFISSGSSLGGDQVNAYSLPLAIAQLGVSEWVFDEPIVRFGAYFENNSRFDDAVLEFYDISGNLIGTEIATVSEDGQTWVWNGWESGTPIHRIVSTGNDVEFLNGFIWFDDVQISHPSQPGDVNRDGVVDLTDVSSFIDVLATGGYQVEADLNNDNMVTLHDVALFADAIGG